MKLSDYYPVGMTDCEREGIAGNCGKACDGYLNLKCDEWLEVHAEGEPMKQEILCPKCHDELEEMFKKKPVPKNEHIKFLPGRAIRAFICDFCGKPIEPLTECAAFSVWTDTAPFIQGWERNFIIHKEE